MALDRQRIVAEAVALLDAEGLDGVTTRKLAARLGVQSPTLYWHLPNKAALVTAIADAILDQQFGDMSPPEPDQHWQDWLSGLAERLRRALLAHPDGARVISASQLSLTMAAISELAMSTLVARGIPLRQARVIVLTVERFTVGHVLEEQAPRPDADALKNFDMATFAEQHPTAVAAIAEYFQPGRTVDDLFRDCLEVVIEGAAVKAGTVLDRPPGRPGGASSPATGLTQGHCCRQ
ncbi:TetR/AcrR family transcriptional regulator C-terminal domain-containing protein [Micromonospora sp. DR5-3]|uniref:TetR/AcrR family transcriptional regulator C-terminal domain-containing protein n=1 Tax=unclassified Micromonospora TaxID=2617518 RepID=UPI0011D55405|nr:MULTISPECIES: TetR/AcrR family transcriptional regulator C-terminal domain-containing protein [unclassified Micromonospora]MCW3819590.1 TetR/AcrR family transcriptional regulator C-terminal domain-containing protein [Micromonospora sp. DR5-3]TYC19960.1 TetR family transcriptional regulator [Micromonospora sp. MP36]